MRRVAGPGAWDRVRPASCSTRPATGSAVIDPGLEGFACPTGVRISGGGVPSTCTPGVEIEGDSFETFGWSGTFDSATEVHGEYDLQPANDCPYTLMWSASSG